MRFSVATRWQRKTSLCARLDSCGDGGRQQAPLLGKFLWYMLLRELDCTWNNLSNSVISRGVGDMRGVECNVNTECPFMLPVVQERREKGNL